MKITNLLAVLIIFWLAWVTWIVGLVIFGAFKVENCESRAIEVSFDFNYKCLEKQH